MRRTLMSRRPGPDQPLVRWSLTRPAAYPLTWDIQSRGPLAIVVIAGELDIDTAASLGEQLAPLADAGRYIILDLAGVRFCDCAGLNMFLRVHKRASAAGGSLYLAALIAPIRRLITLTRLSDALVVAASTADAIAALDAVAVTGPPLPRPEAGR